MVVHDLTADECREMLARSNLCRLACARADQPYVVPVYCYFDPADDCLYSFATLGRKIDWMRANPRVCVEVSQIADRFHWITVIVTGRYEELSDSAEDAEARRRAHALFDRHREWWLPATSTLADGEPNYPAVVYRIRIDSVTGRRAFRSRA
jgi:nitroimidazol reductase NimA-like FMN-containing flavoprotein (pyridoxamine 5'-phosphate oxidase superfamily)